MQTVTSEWLYERGGLHDARVVWVRKIGSVVEIAVDDEWANARGLSQPEGQETPGVLVVEDFSATNGELSTVTGGWISEVTMRGDQLNLVFCDRPALSFRTGAAWWRSGGQAI
jgi:hypothetical protein